MTDHTEPDAVDELLDKWERDAQDTIRGYKAMGGKEPHESRRVLRLIAAVRKYRESLTAAAEFPLDDLKASLEGTPHGDTVEVAYGSAVLSWDAARNEAEALLTDERGEEKGRG